MAGVFALNLSFLLDSQASDPCHRRCCRKVLKTPELLFGGGGGGGGGLGGWGGGGVVWVVGGGGRLGGDRLLIT